MESLFVQIAEQVERLNADVRAFDRALEEAPEVFQPVCVDMASLERFVGRIDILMENDAEALRDLLTLLYATP